MKQLQRLAFPLSLLAFLTMLGRAFLEFRFVPEVANGLTTAGSVGMFLLQTLAFFGVWIWALVGMVQGRKGWTIALLVFNLITGLGGVFTTTVLCPSPCRTFWPTIEMAVWANILLGLAAAAAVAVRLRQPRT